MLPLTKEEIKSYQDAKLCYVCGKRFLKIFTDDKNYWKVINHCFIKEFSNKFEGQFECLRENKEKYKTLSVLIEKEVTNIDKDGNESVFSISYKI